MTHPGNIFILSLAKKIFLKFNSFNRWAVVIAEQESRTDARVMEDVVQEAVTG